MKGVYPLNSNQVAVLSGLTARRINQIVSEGLLIKDDDNRIDCIQVAQFLEYNFKDQHGLNDDIPEGQEPLNQERERARLFKEQADNVALKNMVLRSELAPIEDLSSAIGLVGSGISTKLQSLMPLIREIFPTASVSQMKRVEALIHECHNDLANMKIEVKENDSIQQETQH